MSTRAKVLLILVSVCATAVPASAQWSFEGWGVLVDDATSGHVLFETPSDNSRYYLENYGSFGAGDTVVVTGEINSDCYLATVNQNIDACIDQNTIAEAYLATGDMNGDGVIDYWDGDALANWIWYDTLDVEPFRADVNGDCRVDTLDLDEIFGCLRQWPPGACEWLTLTCCSVSVDFIGTRCCRGLTGNVNCDPDDICDIGDLTKIVDFCFLCFGLWCWPQCMDEANCDGSSDGVVDMGDLTKLIDYLFISYTPTAVCGWPR